jgi:hypothetical protein
MSLMTDEHLRFLEENGYVVIDNVISRDETEQLRIRLWKEYIEKSWPQVKLDEFDTWNEHFPIHNDMAIFAGNAGHAQVLWDVRQNPAVAQIFATIWNCTIDDLIVSFDGFSLMCPSELRQPPTPIFGNNSKYPMHVDQTLDFNESKSDFLGKSNLSSDPWTIQGQFLFEDSEENDGGFYCIPKSHHDFANFAKDIQKINQVDYFNNKFKEDQHKHVQAKKGSVILWDSRTIHWNQFPSSDRNNDRNNNRNNDRNNNLHRTRNVCYICYVPKNRLDLTNTMIRKEAFYYKLSTGHNPSHVQIKPSVKEIESQYSRFTEDPSFEIPYPKLNQFGESLLGF